MYSFRKRSIFRRPATVFASGLFMLALYPTVGAAALPDACTEPVDVPARVHTMFTLSCTPSPAALDQQINAEDLGDNAAYGQTWVLYQRPDPSSRWSQMAATDDLVSGNEYNIYSLTIGQVEVGGSGTGPLPAYQAPQDRMIFTTPEMPPWELFQIYAPMSRDVCGELVTANAATHPDLATRRFVPLQSLSPQVPNHELERLLTLDRLPIKSLLNIDGSVYKTDGNGWVRSFIWNNIPSANTDTLTGYYPLLINEETDPPINLSAARIYIPGPIMTRYMSLSDGKQRVVHSNFWECIYRCKVADHTVPLAPGDEMFSECTGKTGTSSHLRTALNEYRSTTGAMVSGTILQAPPYGYKAVTYLNATYTDLDGDGRVTNGDINAANHPTATDANQMLALQCNAPRRLLCIEVPTP
jgi:hypothetical protein